MKIIIVLLALFFVSPAYSQVNIEKYHNLKKNIGFDGTMSFYISLRTGNTDVKVFDIDGRLNYKGKNFFTFLIGHGEYGWNRGEEFSNSALLHLRYIQKINEIINPEFFTQINYNKSRHLLFRSLVGGGLRLALISDSLTNLYLGSAYMFEDEKLDRDRIYSHPHKTSYHRWSNYISVSSSLTKNSRLSIVVYAQPRFVDFGDIRILSENHLGVSLSNVFSLSVNFSLRYDSKPPNEINELDTNSKVGFTFKL